MPVVLGDFVCLLSRFGVYAMLKWIIDTFYDIVDYGLFSVFDKKNNYRSPQSVPEASEEVVQQNKDGEPLSDSFFDRHIYLVTNIIGFAAVIICCVTPLRMLIGWFGMMMLLSGIVTLAYLFVINTVSFIAVLKKKLTAGIVLSLLGGAMGCHLGQTVVKSDSKSLKVVSTACIWFFICLTASGIVYFINDSWFAA